MEDCSWGLECPDVDVKNILRNATIEGRIFFEAFSVKEKGVPSSRKQVAMGRLPKTMETARGESLEGKPRTCGGRQAKVVCRL